MSAAESGVPISSVSRWAASARVKRKSLPAISTRMFSARSRLIGQVDGGPKRLLITRLNDRWQVFDELAEGGMDLRVVNEVVVVEHERHRSGTRTVH